MCARLPARNVLRCRLPKAKDKLIGGHILHGTDGSGHGSSNVASSAHSPVKAGFVASIEATLSSFLVVGDIKTKDHGTVSPLSVTPLTVSKMGTEMNRELEESWNAYHSLPAVGLAKSLAALESDFQ